MSYRVVPNGTRTLERGASPHNRREDRRRRPDTIAATSPTGRVNRMATAVNVDNFVRAETDRMFADLQSDAGGVNTWSHNRRPAAIDHQTVIRLNRDTLYSFAIVDISEGATLSLPDAGARYLSAMVVNQDHYINRLFHEPGDHDLTAREFDTPWVMIGVRILVDPGDASDAATVNSLQDQLGLTAGAARPFVMPDYDAGSLDATRSALLELAKGMGAAIAGSERPSFGRREDVDPIHHLIGAAAGWGGLPPGEAIYVGAFPGLPADGGYELTVRDVPVDGFWSISVYNEQGFFEPNEQDAYSVNNITAAPNDDGSITVRFGGCDGGRPNCIPITEGWNYLVRLYRPRSEVARGDWTFPELRPA
jgi:hypothetical protein